MASSLYTNPIALNDAHSIEFSAALYAVSMENGEDFMLELSFDNGQNFYVAKRWVAGTDFENDSRYYINALIENVPTTESYVVMRLRNDASSNSDMIYLDDLNVKFCGQTFICLEEGDACDDGDDCTVGDVINEFCECAGTYVDNDEDGFCVGEDPDDNNPCFPDSSSPNCDTEGGCQEIINSDFESGWGIWNDGGSDAARSLNFSSYANSGAYCVRLRDNSRWQSSIFTDVFSLDGYNTVKINFTFVGKSMEYGEDLYLEISNNGGNNFKTIQRWRQGIEFNNDARYFIETSLTGYELNDNMMVRLRCDASGNADWVYIDDVVIEACQEGSTYDNITELEGPDFALIEDDIDAYDYETEEEIVDEAEPVISHMYPSPAQRGQTVKIELESALAEATLQIFDVQGRMIQTSDVSNVLETSIPTNELNAGYYIVNIVTHNGIDSKKLIVVD